MLRKSCRVIYIMLIMVLVMNIGFVSAKGTYNEWYSIFPKSTISVAYIGDSGIFTSSLTDALAASLKEKYNKPINNDNLSEKSADSAELLKMAATAAAKKPDLVFAAFDGNGEDVAEYKQNIESAVRTLISLDRDIKIAFIVMPEDKQADAMIEVAKYYNIGMIRFDEYVNRRTEAKVFEESEIIDDGLSQKGAELLSECIIYFSDSAFLVPTYVKESMSGKQDTTLPDSNPDTKGDEPQKDRTDEELDVILSESTIVSIYRNRAVQNGENCTLKGGAVLPGRLDKKLCYPVGTVKRLFGIGVKYIPKEKAVVLNSGEKKMKLNFQNSIVDLDGETVDIEYTPILYKGTTYLPERAIAVLTGFNICSDDGMGVIYPEKYELTASEQKRLIQKAKALYAEME